MTLYDITNSILKFFPVEQFLESKTAVANIEHDSVVNGEGLRTVVYLQGCKHHCEGCHNSSTWDFHSENAKIMTLQEILDECLKNKFKSITWSGGDPLYKPLHVFVVSYLLKKQGFNIWCYTGFKIEELLQDERDFYKYIPALSVIDTLVDGPFELNKKSLEIAFRGSTNQRIIDVQKTLASYMLDKNNYIYEDTRYEKGLI